MNAIRGVLDFASALMIVCAIAAALLVGAAAPFPGAERALSMCGAAVVAALILRLVGGALGRPGPRF